VKLSRLLPRLRPTALRVVTRTPLETTTSVNLFNGDEYTVNSGGMPVLRIRFRDGGIEVIPLVPFLAAPPEVLRAWADHHEREVRKVDPEQEALDAA
jgi:hypothetical protein